MSTKTALLLASGLSFVSAWACQEAEDEPRAGGITIGGPSAPTGKPSGQGGGDGDMSTDGSIEGAVVQYTNDLFASTSAFFASAQVSILNPSTTDVVEASYDGSDFFAEGDVRGQRWVLVEPSDAAAFPTLTWQNFVTDQVSVPVVPRDVLDQIFQNITTPTEVDLGRSQLLFRILDAGGRGVLGVKADGFAASVPVIAYREDSLWPAYLDETTDEGLAFVANLEAPVFPGQASQVVLTGAIDAEIEVRLVRGAITVITVLVP